MGASVFLRARTAGWVGAAVWSVGPLLTEEQAASAQDTIPELAAHAPPPWTVLKPAPASRKELAAAFSKPTPRSMADLKAMQQHIEALVPRLSQAVVAVEVGYASGSGVVISEDGLVLTAGHDSGEPGLDVRSEEHTSELQ